MLYLIRARGTSVARVAIIAIAFTTIWRIHGALHLAISLGLFVCAVFALSDYARFMVMPATLWLGAISYPLYLVHWPINVFCGSVLRDHYSLPLRWVVFLVCIAVAAIIYHAIEDPFRRGRVFSTDGGVKMGYFTGLADRKSVV